MKRQGLDSSGPTNTVMNLEVWIKCNLFTSWTTVSFERRTADLSCRCLFSGYSEVRNATVRGNLTVCATSSFRKAVSWGQFVSMSVRRRITAQCNNCGADTGTDFFAVNDTAQPTSISVQVRKKSVLDITRVSSLSLSLSLQKLFRLQHFLLRKMFGKLLPRYVRKAWQPSYCLLDINRDWIVTSQRDRKKLNVYLYAASVVWWLACWPLVRKFAGPNPAEAVGFFGRQKSSACLPSEGK
jgi:hypothetical protein